ncbi:MAG: class B sortase [Erysipelotrichaceae bacterium]|nr:class B sortase [Erysipelotrichaceae bacterium]
MMKYLRWAWISLCLYGCVISQPERKSATVFSFQLPEINVIHQPVIDPVPSLGMVEIEGVLKESFVQGKDNKEYLYRNADGTATTAGANFLDYRCTIDSDNIIVYGHSSRTSDILFTPLMQYLDEKFARNHQQIVLTYSNEIRVYQLMSIFLFHTQRPSDNDWMIVDYQRDFLFMKAQERLIKRSLYSFEHSSGNQLLTLVTCNTENHDERLIVIGVRIDKKE